LYRYDAGADGEQTYLVIIGSHRNTCLCIEKNGVVVQLAKARCLLPDGADSTFTRYWVGLVQVEWGVARARRRFGGLAADSVYP
jgi:hypothetical protein